MRLGLGNTTSISHKIGGTVAQVLYPNSTGAVILKRTNSEIPGTTLNGDSSNTELDSNWKDVVSTDDENYYFGSSVTNYTGFRIRIKLLNTNIDSFTIIAKGYGAGGGTSEDGWKLYVWNATTESWGSELDGHTEGTKQTLTTTVDTNVSNYIDNDGYINVLCTSYTGTELAGSSSYLYYFTLTTT